VPYLIPNVHAKAGSEIVLLGCDEKIVWKQVGKDVVIEKLPDDLPCEHAWSFRIEI
jgi:hypothetical protein